MAKVGRNDPCPCGSGEKYKKCCLGKANPARKAGLAEKLGLGRKTGRNPDRPSKTEAPPKPGQGWDLDKIGALPTPAIMARLKAFGVAMTEKEFIRQAPDFSSASELAEDWYKRYPVTAKGLDEDFIWMAATVLWPRLTPQVRSSEQLDDMMQQGYDLVLSGKTVEGCQVWLEVWKRLQKRFKPRMKSAEQAESVFQGQQCIYNWCQDLEMELGNAGCSDPGFYRKRIDFCLEYCRCFPESDPLTMHNMRRAAAESYFALGMIEEGERAFQALAAEFPDNVWTYIGWGDAYADLRPKKDTPLDYDKAERIYRLALARNIQEDREVLLERLEDLRQERGSS